MSLSLPLPHPLFPLPLPLSPPLPPLSPLSPPLSLPLLPLSPNPYLSRVMALVVENTFTAIPNMAQLMFPGASHFPLFCFKNKVRIVCHLPPHLSLLIISLGHGCCYSLLSFFPIVRCVVCGLRHCSCLACRTS